MALSTEPLSHTTMTRDVFVLAIATENAAFEPMPHYELARVLRAAADDVLRGSIGEMTLRDSNGNRVGAAGYISYADAMREALA